MDGKPGGNSVTKDMIERSGPAFLQILETVRPDAIVVMSSAIWHGMTDSDATLVAKDIGGIGHVYRYDYAGGSYLAAHTDHPRARGDRTFRPEVWRPRVAAFLDYARNSR